MIVSIISGIFDWLQSSWIVISDLRFCVINLILHYLMMTQTIKIIYLYNQEVCCKITIFKIKETCHFNCQTMHIVVNKSTYFKPKSSVKKKSKNNPLKNVCCYLNVYKCTNTCAILMPRKIPYIVKYFGFSGVNKRISSTIF